MKYIDTYRHKGMRAQLVESLREKGIQNNEVLEAINRVPRHIFMDSSFLEYAYQDKAFPIGSNQTISQPYTVAFQSELLKAEENMKVLEIGTGSGYQTAILSKIAAHVWSIEIIPELLDRAKVALQKIGIENVTFLPGNGYGGWPGSSTFSHIIVTAAAPALPPALAGQLDEGGRLIIPVGENESGQNLYLYCKSGGRLVSQCLLPVRFVPLVEKYEAP